MSLNGVKMRMELTELFRFTRQLRGDGAEFFVEKYGVKSEMPNEWIFGIGVTDYAIDVMRDYVSSDIECLMAFVAQFKLTHRVILSMFSSFAGLSEDRFIKRREFKENMTILKRFYSLLNAYEKKYILRGYGIYLDFETYNKLIKLIYCDDTTQYKQVSATYQLSFIRAKKDINDLLGLYNISDRIVSCE